MDRKEEKEVKEIKEMKVKENEENWRGNEGVGKEVKRRNLEMLQKEI
jgi:hypothetical protein